MHWPWRSKVRLRVRNSLYAPPFSSQWQINENQAFHFRSIRDMLFCYVKSDWRYPPLLENRQQRRLLRRILDRDDNHRKDYHESGPLGSRKWKSLDGGLWGSTFRGGVLDRSPSSLTMATQRLKSFSRQTYQNSARSQWFSGIPRRIELPVQVGCFHRSRHRKPRHTLPSPKKSEYGEIFIFGMSLYPSFPINQTRSN